VNNRRKLRKKAARHKTYKPTLNALFKAVYSEPVARWFWFEGHYLEVAKALSSAEREKDRG
jgi:hypothetical protein